MNFMLEQFFKQLNKVTKKMEVIINDGFLFFSLMKSFIFKNIGNYKNN